jgi:hypothetical protein
MRRAMRRAMRFDRGCFDMRFNRLFGDDLPFGLDPLRWVG